MMQKLIKFLNRLEAARIYYRLNKVRDAIMVEIAVPGERWEVEFLPDGSVEVERFKSGEFVLGESELEILFRDFSD